MKMLVAATLLLLLAACGPTAGLKKYMSAEDEAVLELLADIKKNPGKKELLDLLPDMYQRAMDSRASMKDYVLRDNAAGDRWVLWRRQLEASQSITDAVLAVPQASAALKNPVQFRDEISYARQQAASEYYNLGLEYLNYNNRPYAQKALEALNKANKEVPGYQDVSQLIRQAEEMALIIVMVNPVDYYNYGWSYWGLNNDYLQWQMLNDLNARSYRNVRFFSESEIRSRRLHPERVVDMRFNRLMISNPYTERRQYSRSKEIQTSSGTTTTKPVFSTVTATVYVTKRYINGDADLECRIYDVPTNRNILFDRFPGRYNWLYETASYTGDQRALSAEDWQLINNRFTQYPSREDIAQQLIRDCYTALLSRIQQGVSFDAY